MQRRDHWSRVSGLLHLVWYIAVNDSAVTKLTDKSAAIPSVWYWPLRPFTGVVTACLMGIAFLANFPAVEVPHAGQTYGKYGPHFEHEVELEHGWPARYLRRDYMRPLPIKPYYELHSPWQPWTGVSEFSCSALIMDVAIALIAIGVVGASAQWWRSRRRRFQQVTLSDLFALMAFAALICAWIAHVRFEQQHERSLIAGYYARSGVQKQEEFDFERGAAVPGFLPATIRKQYGRLFDRVIEMNVSGETMGIATQFPHLLVLRYPSVGPDFRSHLLKMPQLEAIDAFMQGFDYLDETEQATTLRDLPPMPNLRGLNLYDTNVTDADMVWLTQCPRLEVIDLSGTNIGDRGLECLSRLPHLKKLWIDSDRLTDVACQLLSKIPSLEELSLHSSNIHDAGVLELAKLSHLHELVITANASESSFAELKAMLQNCELRNYRSIAAPPIGSDVSKPAK